MLNYTLKRDNAIVELYINDKQINNYFVYNYILQAISSSTNKILTHSKVLDGCRRTCVIKKHATTQKQKIKLIEALGTV